MQVGIISIAFLRLLRRSHLCYYVENIPVRRVDEGIEKCPSLVDSNGELKCQHQRAPSCPGLYCSILVKYKVADGIENGYCLKPYWKMDMQQKCRYDHEYAKEPCPAYGISVY